MKILGHTLYKAKAESPAILLFLLLAVIPPLMGILYAILYSLGITGLMSEGFTLSYWEQTLGDMEFWFSLGYTFYIALVAILITIIFALGLTLFMKKPLQKGLSCFLGHVPLAFSAIVVAFLVFRVASQSGLLARIAWQLGWITDSAEFPDLVNDSFGIGIIAAHTFMAVPFFSLYFMNLYEGERIREFRRVAHSLGASRIQQLFRIEIPILLQRAFPTIILYTIFVLGSYEIPLVLGQQSPQMMSVLIIRKLRKFSLATIPEAYVTALLFIGITLLLLMVIFRTRTSYFDLND